MFQKGMRTLRARAVALRAVLLAALEGGRNALAGAGFPIMPLVWGGLVVIVLIAGVVVLIVRFGGAEQAGAGGARAVDIGGGSTHGVHPGELIGPDGSRIGWLPLGPRSDDDPADEPEHPEQAALELQFGANADLRHVRYTLTYHPGDAGEVVYVHHARLDSTKLELVPVAQIGSDPLRYRWPQAGQARLCSSGLALDQARPSCEGIVRISSKQVGVRAARTHLTMVATPQPPQGLPGENAAVEQQPTTLAARRELALRDVFFVSMLAVGIRDSRLFLMERNEQGTRFRKQLLPPAPGIEPLPSYHLMELARDGSRLYLLSSDERELYEWRGQNMMPAPIATHPEGNPRVFGGMTATDSGLCVIEMIQAAAQPPSAALRCRRQASGVWGTARVLTSGTDGQGQTEPPAYAMGSLGDSVLVALRQRRDEGALVATYALDASMGWPVLQAARMQESAPDPGRIVHGVLPLVDQGTHQEYVLFGSFPLTSGPTMTFLPVSADASMAGGQSPAYMAAGRPFSAHPEGNSAVDRAVVWFDPGSRSARIFLYQSYTLRSVYYDVLRRRTLSERALEMPPGWTSLAVLSLLQLDSRPVQLLIGARAPGERNSAWLLVYRLPGFGLPPQLEASLDMSGRDPAMGGFFINGVTRNVMMLSPADQAP